MRKVESNQVVAEQKPYALGECIQLLQRVANLFRSGGSQRLATVAPHGGKLVDSAILDADLKIDRQRPGRPALAGFRVGGDLCHYIVHGLPILQSRLRLLRVPVCCVRCM